jgi:hypothetical protein
MDVAPSSIEDGAIPKEAQIRLEVGVSTLHYVDTWLCGRITP